MSGLVLVEIATRIDVDAAVVRAVLDAEVERGRVARDDAGRYRLVVETFDARVLAALLAIDGDNVSVERREASAA